MHNPPSSPPVKMTINIPPDLFQQLDQERERLAAELHTRLSVTQIAIRVLRLGLGH